VRSATRPENFLSDSMDTLLILLSLGLGNHHPKGQDITIHPLRRLMSSSVNPKSRNFLS
jgi:hypothetical protein